MKMYRIKNNDTRTLSLILIRTFLIFTTHNTTQCFRKCFLLQMSLQEEVLHMSLIIILIYADAYLL